MARASRFISLACGTRRGFGRASHGLDANSLVELLKPFDANASAIPLQGLRLPGPQRQKPRRSGRESRQDVPRHDLQMRKARPRPLLQRHWDILGGVRGRARAEPAGVGFVHFVEECPRVDLG